MSFDPEELRVGVLEAFASTVGLSRYRTDFKELPGRLFRVSAARLAPKPKQEPIPFKEICRRRIAGMAHLGACPHCGALAPSHRCPVFVVGVST